MSGLAGDRVPKDPRFARAYEDSSRVGDVPDPSGLATVENGGCGDVVRASVRIEAGRLAVVRFKAHGCSSTVAAMACLAGLVEGKPVAEARAVTAAALELALGGLHALRRHGPELAVEALAAALEDHARRAR